MCLAVPGRVIEIEGENALVDFHGNRAQVSSVLTPGVAPNEWVLVHAGFAIAKLDEAAAKETWSYLRQISEAEVADAIGTVETVDVR